MLEEIVNFQNVNYQKVNYQKVNQLSEWYLKNKKHLDLIKCDAQTFSIWTKLNRSWYIN